MSAPTANERITFRVRHEDEHLLVVEKRAHLVTAPGVGHEHDTLLNGVFARYSGKLSRLGDKRDWGLVHRLDKDTSGLLLVALTPDAYDALRALFETREVRKFYWAVCRSTPNKPSGVIKRPIIEEVERIDRYTSSKSSRIGSSGKPAVTAYRLLQSSASAALVEARPVTGRLHQVRVHLDSIGCTVLGDEVYGPKNARGASPRLALHAHRITLEHPITGEPLDIRTLFPRDLRPMLRRMMLDLPGASANQAEEVASDAVGEEEA
ncbi:MAG: RluA family pseudouridine synthase [Phycisphaerales bacterium]|nr:RluA family pseudouridine synthase [Phycisphaerales bacterium]